MPTSGTKFSNGSPVSHFFGGILLFILVPAFFTAAFLFLDDAPVVAPNSPPVPEDVVAARELFHDLRAATLTDTLPLVATTPQLNSAIRLGSRLIPGFRGDVTIANQTLLSRISIPVPWWSGRKWFNLSGAVPPFQDGLVFENVTLGSITIPPRLALFVGRLSGNLFLGKGDGDTIVNAFSGMEIYRNTVEFDVTLNEIGENGLLNSAFNLLRGQDFPSEQDIDAAYQRVRTAMDAGELPSSGSFLPYIEFALRDALTHTKDGNLVNAYTASIFGLTQACGPNNFNAIVGRFVLTTTRADHNWTTECSELTLNGRIDSRRHFIASAAIHAASNRSVSYSIGEFKELHDTISGAGGFDFTDIAANSSGIKLTNYLVNLPAQQWPEVIDRLTSERAVIVGFDGIPTIMRETRFNTIYGSIDSVIYRSMLQTIDDRIDDLDLYSMHSETSEHP